jgi:hypothetical protein
MAEKAANGFPGSAPHSPKIPPQLGPRKNGFKDLGYYIAEGYEGLVTKTRTELAIGMRHYFQPRMCMLQWRHSGLVNFLNRTPTGLQVRLEGLWIG